MKWNTRTWTYASIKFNKQLALDLPTDVAAWFARECIYLFTVSVLHKKCIAVCMELFRRTSVFDTRSVLNLLWHERCTAICTCLFRRLSLLGTKMYYSFHVSVQKCITVCTCLFRRMSVFGTRSVLQFARVCSGGCQCLTQEVYCSLHMSVRNMSVFDTGSILQFAHVCLGGPGQGSAENGQRGERERACFI